MGTTISRPFLHTVESSLLALAYIIDSLVHFAERIFSSAIHLCLAPSFPFTTVHDSPDTTETNITFDNGARSGAAPAASSSARWQQDRKARFRMLWTIRKKDDRLERRKRRAEWAAAGLDPDRMENMSREKKNSGKKQTKAEMKERTCPSSPSQGSSRDSTEEKLSIEQSPPAQSADDLVEVHYAAEPTIRPVPRASQAGTAAPLLVQPKPRRAVPQDVSSVSQPVPAQHLEITPTQLSNTHDTPQRAQNIFAHTRGAASLDLSRAQPKKSRTLITPESSRSTTPTNLGLSRTMTMPGLLLEDANAASNRLGNALARGLTPPIFSAMGISRPQSAASCRQQQRHPMSSASSIAEMRSTQQTPPPVSQGALPRVATMVDLACKSRWEANARERKVWKGEVNRIALHRLNEQQQQAAAISRQSSPKPTANAA